MTTNQTELAVVLEAQALYQGNGHPERLLASFRAAPLHVCRQVSPPAVPVVDVPGMGSWLQAFTTLQRLTSAVGAEHECMRLLGAEILDQLLPSLPRGLGVLLDPGTSHMVAFPPVEPIVARALALQLPPAV